MNLDFQVNIEKTPNPDTLKFLFNVNKSSTERPLDSFQPVEYTDSADAEDSPLAATLFGFPWMSKVFIGPEFISITKQDWVDWNILEKPLKKLIENHFQQGLPLFENPELQKQENGYNRILDTDSEEIRLIKKTLTKEIRPVLALDGGDIEFRKYEDQILYISLKGACNGCPSSKATLKNGVEVRLKEVLPTLKEVLSV